MSVINFIQLICFVFLMCAGQLLFKKTALILLELNYKLKTFVIHEFIINLIKIPYFFIAILIYASATFFWLFILQKIPLSLAYPFTAMAMVIIPILSMLLFNEKLDINYWFGACLIVLGILVISIKSL